MASAYVGTSFIPPLFGLIADHVSIALYPFFIALILILMVIMSEQLHRKTVKSSKDLV